MSAVIETEGLERRFGMLVAVDDVSVSINEGEITSIIGPNGAGKSTFYNLLAGQLDPTDGDVRIRPREGGDLVDVTDMEPFEINRLGLSRGFQINNVFDGLSVTDNIRIARISHDDRTLDLTALARQDEELTAEVLEVSVKTVEVYRQRLKDKLGVESAALLTRYAVAWQKEQIRGR